jgi:FKBP-type peptidyl-prolyl cis-trans isomerase
MWIHRKYTAVLLLSIPALFITGCVNDDREEKEKHEAELINQYLADNGISSDSKTAGGIYFVEDVAGSGLTPVTDDFVIVNYTGRTIEDNVIYETTDETLKDEWPAYINFTNYVFGPVKFKAGHSLTGVNEGLTLMKEGGKARLILPSDKAFFDDVPYVYDIELIKVIKDPVAYEDSVLSVYRATKGYDTTTYYKGILFRETVTPNPSDQRTVQTNDTILFWFTGRIVDGCYPVIRDDRIFDSNEGDARPVKMVYGKTTTISGDILALPAGLKTALDTMREGTHATAILPYTQGFNEVGLKHKVRNYTIVPPYQTIVYDIVVEDIIPPAK